MKHLVLFLAAALTANPAAALDLDALLGGAVKIAQSWPAALQDLPAPPHFRPQRDDEGEALLHPTSPWDGAYLFLNDEAGHVHCARYGDEIHQINRRNAQQRRALGYPRVVPFSMEFNLQATEQMPTHVEALMECRHLYRDAQPSLDIEEQVTQWLAAHFAQYEAGYEVEPQPLMSDDAEPVQFWWRLRGPNGRNAATEIWLFVGFFPDYQELVIDTHSYRPRLNN